MSNTAAYETELELESEFEHSGQNEMESENFAESNGHSSNGFAPYERRGGSAEYDFETETEGEQFSFSFKKFFKKAAPFLKSALKVAAPIVGTAIGGPAGTLIGGAASTLLRESESEGELEGEFESEWESEFESPRGAHRSTGTPRQNWIPEDYAAETMAAMASKAESEAEAEAYIGAATATALSRSDDARIRAVIPHLVHGAAALSQVIRKQPQIRPVLRAMPEVARLTHRELSRRILSGRPVNRKTAARAFYQQAQQMLTDPQLCGNTLYRNIRAQRDFARVA